MVRFKKLRWKNLLATGNAFIEIDLDGARSTLCHGQNGSGKSTLIEALSFVLYGKPFRKINKPALLNSINKKNCVVEIELEANNKEYIIRRGIKPNIFEIIENGVLLNQDSASRDYQDIIEKSILKMSHKSFFQIVVLGSATYVPFMQLSSPARRDIIEDLLDIQVFSTMNVLLKEKVSSIKTNISENKYNIDITKEKIELQKEYLRKVIKNSKQIITEKQDIIKEQQETLDGHTASISKLNSELDVLFDSIKDSDSVSKKRDKFQAAENDLTSKLNKINKDILFYNDNKNCPMCKQGIDHAFHVEVQDQNDKKKLEIEDAITICKDHLDTVKERITEIHLISKSISKYQNEIAVINDKVSTISFYINKIQKEIVGLQSQESVDNSDIDGLELNKRNLTKYEKEKESLLIEKSTLDIASVILKDGGIKSKIIKQYIPIINKLINKYLAQMDFDVNFNLDENFNETIKSRFRDEFSYESFSEGEKSRIDVSLLFAWRAISKLRNSNSTNILILDEIGDSSLDTSGSDEFIRILQELAGTTNIIMISHRVDGKQDTFDRVIEFVNEKNFTRIIQ